MNPDSICRQSLLAHGTAIVLLGAIQLLGASQASAQEADASMTYEYSEHQPETAATESQVATRGDAIFFKSSTDQLRAYTGAFLGRAEGGNQSGLLFEHTNPPGQNQNAVMTVVGDGVQIGAFIKAPFHPKTRTKTGQPKLTIFNFEDGAGCRDTACRRNTQALYLESQGPWATAHMQNNKGNDVLYVAKTAGAGRYINARDESKKRDVFTVAGDGTTKVLVLEVMGGADLAEDFAVATQGVDSAADPKPGMVVSIDPSNEGNIQLSGEAYDRRVAGVVSGAGGLAAGLLLGVQEGMRENQRSVALSGRVHVRCNASSGAIRPGDLLTTSDQPGHCMKVTDHVRAQGAVLGKAMGTLEEGSGLILALVTLQ